MRRPDSILGRLRRLWPAKRPCGYPNRCCCVPGVCRRAATTPSNRNGMAFAHSSARTVICGYAPPRLGHAQPSTRAPGLPDGLALDGELMAFGSDGLPSFPLLCDRMLHGKHCEALWEKVCELGLEGVVAKKRSGHYFPAGVTSIKTKNRDYWRYPLEVEANAPNRSRRLSSWTTTVAASGRPPSADRSASRRLRSPTGVRANTDAAHPHPSRASLPHETSRETRSKSIRGTFSSTHFSTEPLRDIEDRQ